MSEADINYAVLIGVLESPFELDTTNKILKIYSTFILVQIHEEIHRIPISIQEDLLAKINPDIFSAKIKAEGYILGMTQDNKLKLSVRIDKEIVKAEDEDEDNSFVRISGFICSRPKLRKTQGGKSICDFMLTSVTKIGVKSYVPAIAWNDLAHFISRFKVGKKVHFIATLRSRRYAYKGEDGTRKEKEVYELFVHNMRKVK